MKYIKFLLKCILAASPAIVLIVYTLTMPFGYMDEEYASWRFTKRVSCGQELAGEYFDTVILGDSGAMSSYVPEVLSPSGKCINLAVGGATSIEMYYFLKNYLENHEKPKHVIIMFAPFHYTHVDNYDTRTMYFKALSISDAKQLYTMAKTYGADGIYSDNVLWDEIACRAGLPTKYLPAIMASRICGRYRDNTMRYQALIDSKGYGTFGTLDGCDGLSYECSYSGLEFDNNVGVLSQYFNLLIGTCEYNDIDVLIVQEALNEASYESISPNYVEQYKTYLEILKSTYPEAVIETELRCYPNQYFGDVSHLNEAGARIFSEEIKSTYPDFFE